MTTEEGHRDDDRAELVADEGQAITRDGSGDDLALGATLPGARPGDAIDMRLARAQARAALFGKPRDPVLVGRYEIVTRIGAGAMGVVYQARDPKLDRTVAVKLLDAGRERAGSERFVREAKALAKLAHPNVVTVHEVDTVGAELFIVTEFVDGLTLRGWLEEEQRSRAEVIGTFIAAGRGLEAAHAAGLVHRDFKPDNVMVGHDGRVRVLDFGLARLGHVEPEEGDETDAARVARLNPKLTSASAVVGTPSYMSPEQHGGRAVDAKSDQFAYCVALHEALTGELPFTGDDMTELSEAKVAGDHTVVATSLPPWLREILSRGLASDPADRYPSMAEILAALERDPERERRRRLTMAALVAGFVALTTVAVVGFTRDPHPSAVCGDGADKAAAVWNDGRRQQLLASFQRSGRPYAEDVHRRVLAIIEDYVASWTQMRTSACEATRVHGHQSEPLMDLRMGCLDRRLEELAALVDVLSAGADRELVDEAIDAARGLTPITGCADAEALTTRVPPPTDPAALQAVAGLQRQMAEVKALLQAGQAPKALEQAERLAKEAPAVNHLPTQAEAQQLLGLALFEASKLDEAVVALQAAGRLAAMAKDDDLSASIWVKLVVVTGMHGRYTEADTLLPVAEAATLRAGDKATQRAVLEEGLGSIRIDKSEFKQAKAHLERAIELYQQAHGCDSSQLAQAVVLLARVLVELDQHERAQQQLDRAVTILERAYGPSHLRVAPALTARGVALKRQGKYREALPFLQRAHDITHAALGELHRDVATTHTNLGNVHTELGNIDQAHHHLTLAVKTFRQIHGNDHRDVARALANLALATADDDESLRLNEEALAILERVLGVDSPGVAATRNNFANRMAKRGRCAEALGHFEKAQVVFERSRGREHTLVAYPLVGLGNCLIDLGRPQEALPPLLRGLKIWSKTSDLALPAEAEFALARARWDTGDRQSALDLARASRDHYQQAGRKHDATRAKVEQWLAAHGSR